MLLGFVWRNGGPSLTLRVLSGFEETTAPCGAIGFVSQNNEGRAPVLGSRELENFRHLCFHFQGSGRKQGNRAFSGLSY